MTGEPFFTSAAGVQYRWKDEADGSATIIASQDVGAALEHAKAQANHNDGWSPSRELRRVGFIPAILIHKWLKEEGWNALNPDHADRLCRKMNDPDYAFLRTAPGQVGMSNGVMR